MIFTPGASMFVIKWLGGQGQRQRLDAETAGVGLHVQLAAGVPHRVAMAVVVGREVRLAILLKQDFIAFQHGRVELYGERRGAQRATGDSRPSECSRTTVGCVVCGPCEALANVDLRACRIHHIKYNIPRF